MHLKDHQETIAGWGRRTFGESSAQKIAHRMNIEVAELLLELGHLETAGPEEARSMIEHARLECADVFIVLVQVAAALGVDLEKAVEAKMDVNRSRKWARTPTGKVQHVAETPAQRNLLGPEDYKAVFQDCLDKIHKVDPSKLTFVEEGSGLTLQLKQWYILWDSGGLVLTSGFDSAQDAYDAAMRGGYGIGLVIPTWDPALREWSGTDGINVFKGEHLYLYWAREHGK